MSEHIQRPHIIIPNFRGVAETNFWTCLATLTHRMGVEGMTPCLTVPTHTIVQTARQVGIDGALEDPDCTHVLFIDDDMTFTPEQYFHLEKEMLEYDLDFIGALAFANSFPTKPCVFGLNPDFDEWGEEPWWHIVTDYPMGQRFEVAATGFAMCLISVRMLKEMRTEPPFEFPTSLKWAPHFTTPGCKNEDVAFCLNARKKGFRIFVDSRVSIGHVSKERPIIDEETYANQGEALTIQGGVTPCRLGKDLVLEFAREHH